MSPRFTSVFPAGGLVGEIGALRAYYAEALAGGGLHDAPGPDHADTPRAEALEPAHLRLDVVALDVQVHAAFVTDLLHLDVHLIGAGLQSQVERVGRLYGAHRQAECRTPELGRELQLLRAAVDDESGEAAFMHGLWLRPGSLRVF